MTASLNPGELVRVCHLNVVLQNEYVDEAEVTRYAS